MRSRRIAAFVSGLWGGLLAGIGFIGAPAGFAVGTREVAGRAAGRMFAQEAHLSLAVALVLFFIVRRQAQAAARAGTGSVFGAEVLLVLLTLFCTIAGHFALLPLMAAARGGQGFLSFGALHALAAGFYGVKTLSVLALSWRLAGAPPEPAAPSAARPFGTTPVSPPPSF